MRLVTFDLGPGPVDAPSATSARIADIKLAAAILAGAASVAEAELASSDFETRAATRKLLRSCRAFDAAVVGPAIAAVEAARSAMPDARDASDHSARLQDDRDRESLC